MADTNPFHSFEVDARWGKAMATLRGRYPEQTEMAISTLAFNRSEVSGASPLQELEAMADEPGNLFPPGVVLGRNNRVIKVTKKYDRCQLLYVYRNVPREPMGDVPVPPDRHVFTGTPKQVLDFYRLWSDQPGHRTAWFATDGHVMSNFNLWGYYLDEIVRGSRKDITIEVGRYVLAKEPEKAATT